MDTAYNAKKNNFDLRNYSVIDTMDMKKFDKTEYDSSRFSQAKPFLNYR